MLKKLTFIVFFLSPLFLHSDSPFHMDASAKEEYRLGQEPRLIYERPKNRKFLLQFSLNKKPMQDAENEEFERLEKQLQELVDEMKKLEKEAREKFLKEILPRIKEEMEKLREKLRKWQDEEDESAPTQVEGVEI